MDVSSPLDTILHWCLVHRNVDRLLATARESIAHRRNLDEPRVESAVREIFGDAVVDPGEGWREAWLFDSDASGASFAEETNIVLPARLIPPPPAFVTRTATAAAPRSKSRRVPTRRAPT